MLCDKLKECRKQAGLSQEELAQKCCVSRQAVTKWENNRGMPNIESLQTLARLFDVSVDYLLDDGNILTGSVVKESISFSDVYKKGCFPYDTVVKGKYAKAKKITSLICQKKLSLIESVIDFFVSPGLLQTADACNNISAYYLVELENRQLLVNFTKEFIESRELTATFSGKKMIIGNQVFVKLKELKC